MRNAALIVALLIAWVGPAAAQNADPNDLFPRPPQLTDAIAFWTRVYTEVDSTGGFLHDSRDLGIVYATLHFGPDASSRQRRRATDRAADHYRAILKTLASGERGGLTTEEARVLALFPAGTSNEEFNRAAGRLRFQLGQSDRYRAGLIRSGRWKSHIVEALDAEGLPRELAALPHVESSFDPTAYSKVGAAGMWQFTRSTGLRYMQIDHIIDERRDPFLSTAAAIRLLKDNYAVIQSWPLALTAYNHGLAGMRRAVQQQGTDDIGVIVERYTSRTFGFASRNFYAAFLAALDVDRDAERYFGSLAIEPPEPHIVIEVPAYIDASPLARALGVPVSELRRLNPALMDTVWAGDKYVPKGFELRLPDTLTADAETLLARVGPEERYAAQRPDLYHRVRRGETLSGIADQYGLSLAALVRANGLSNRNFIRAGQQLALPVSGGQTPRTAPAAQTLAAEGRQYVVRSGDSIDRIARRLGVDQDALLAVNAIANRNRIYVGQILDVPGAADAAPRAETLVAAAAPAPVSVTAAAAPAGPPVALGPAVRGPDAAVRSEAPGPGASAPATLGPVALGPVDPRPAALRPVAPGPVAPGPRPIGPVAIGPVAATPESEPFDFATADVPAEPAAELVTVADPVTIDPEPDLESNVLASTQASLAADPSDYSVADDSTIEVQDMETLGHYADWLGIRTQRLRDINGMPFGEPVVYGQRIKLDFSVVDRSTFEARRLAYQEQRQEAFFSSHQIADIVDHVVQPGESLWLLSLRTYDVPVWLLRQYNPNIELDRVAPGTIVKFPRLRPIGTDAARDDSA